MKSTLTKAGIVAFVAGLSGPALGEITLNNGYWSTSFEMDDWTHTTTPTVLPNGMVARSNSCAGPSSFPCAKTSNTGPTQVLAAANNPGGVECSAAQVHYFYTGIDGKGAPNDSSSGLTISFPSDLIEFWLRFYVYYPPEMNSTGWKILYFNTNSGSRPWMASPYWSSYAGMYFPGGSSQVVRSLDYPWSWSDDNDRQGYGEWIPMEVYIKNNSEGQSDGIYRVWRGNDLIIDRKDIHTGVSDWSGVAVGSNGDGITGPADTVVGIRFDDIAVATPDYPGFIDDGNGNDRIGLLGETPVPCHRASLQAPRSLRLLREADR